MKKKILFNLSYFCSSSSLLQLLLLRGDRGSGCSILLGLSPGELATTDLIGLAALDPEVRLTPLAEKRHVPEELGLDGVNKLGELLLLLGLHVGDGKDGGGLLVDELAEASLALDDAEGHALLAAESGEPHNELDGVDVVGDHNKLRLVLGDEVGHVVETVLDAGLALLGEGLEGLLHRGTLLGGGLVTAHRLLDRGSTLKTTLLGGGLLLGLHPVEELEESNDGRLVEAVVEHVDGGRDLQTVEKDLLLTLESDVLGPLDKVSEIPIYFKKKMDNHHEKRSVCTCLCVRKFTSWGEGPGR